MILKYMTPQRYSRTLLSSEARRNLEIARWPRGS